MRTKSSCSRILLSVGGIWLLCAVKMGAQNAWATCSGFRGTTDADAVAYLEQDRATLEPECIYRAMRVLRGERYAPAVNVLFGYLDFEVPGVVHGVDASRPTGGAFPAANLLFAFGESILPRVKQVIPDDDQTTLSRLNAAKIYFAIDNNGPGSIGFIAKAARDTSQPLAAKQLRHFAEIAVGYCAKDNKEECQQALNP